MIQETINNYVNLLIIQYRNKAKARATIDLFVRPAFENLFGINEAFDIDTAIGNQLDILGRWVGVSRMVVGVDLAKIYYELSDYDALSDVGMSTYDNSVSAIFKTYRSTEESIYTLTDDQFRTLIKLKILTNHTNSTSQSIDTLIFDFFSTDVIIYDNYDMTVDYVITKNRSVIFEVARNDGYIPKPMGVGIRILIAIENTLDIFGYSDYNLNNNARTYSSYDNLTNGKFLSYADTI